jgi:hypothetical protein
VRIGVPLLPHPFVIGALKYAVSGLREVVELVPGAAPPDQLCTSLQLAVVPVPVQTWLAACRKGEVQGKIPVTESPRLKPRNLLRDTLRRTDFCFFRGDFFITGSFWDNGGNERPKADYFEGLSTLADD